MMRIIKMPAIVLAATLCLIFGAGAASLAGPIRVGVYDYPPLLHVEEGGRPDGIFVDVMDHAAEREGWAVTYVPDTWINCLEGVKSGNIDVICCIGQSEDRARILDFTEPALVIDWGLVYRRRGGEISTIVDLEGRSVSVLEGSIYTSGFSQLMQEFGISVRLVPFREVSEVFRACETGLADAAVSGNLAGFLEKQSPGVERTAIVFSPVKIGYASAKGRRSDIISTLSGHIAALKADDESILNRRYRHILNPGRNGMTEFQRRVGIGLLVALAIAGIFILTLRRTVRVRTSEVQAMNQRMKLAAGAARIGIWDLGVRSGNLICDEMMCELYGFTPEKFPKDLDGWLSRLHPGDRDEIAQAFEAALRGGEFRDAEFRVVLPDGLTKHIKSSATVLRDFGGVPERFVGVNFDITGRKKAEASLLETEMQLRWIVDNFPNSYVSIIDRDFSVCFSSGREFRNQNLDPSAFNGVSVDEIFGEHASLVREHYAGTFGGEERTFELFISSQHQLYRTVPIVSRDGSIDRILVVVENVTTVKSAEDERVRLLGDLAQTRRLESIGRLAGGVAHDFNNMLGVILGTAEMAMARMEPGDPLRSDLEEIHRAATRSAGLTGQLLSFARKQTVTPRVLDMNETVEGSLQILRRLIGENVNLEWIPGRDVWPVMIDPNQVGQILTNLCANARDAIDGVGRIVISTQNVTLDQADCAENADFTPGDFVLLKVSDNGHGIDMDTLTHIFEPFFTTKETGCGTGLGLATVFGVTKQNGGLVKVDSAPQMGATFSIYLPRHAGPIVPESENVSDRLGSRGGETILLVEDEPSVMFMTSRMLERAGYKVFAAGSPGEAMNLAAEHAGEIDLLITDVVMPEMNGQELARELLSLHGNMKHLFMSGYTAEILDRQGKLEEGECYIQKPFSMADLVSRVRKVLRG